MSKDNVLKFQETEPPEAELPRAYYDRGARIVSYVEGDSMAGRPSLIRQGDDLYVKPETDLEAANGKVIICSVNGRDYVKRLDIRKGKIALMSDGRYVTWELQDSDRFELIGVVIGRAGDVA